MNDYTKIQNAKDLAAILVQLVAADARAMQAAVAEGEGWIEAAGNYRQSRAALMALLEAPAGEETA